MPASQPPLVLDDVADLLHDLGAFVGDAETAGMRRAHDRLWRWWTGFCEGVREDPYRASMTTWEAAVHAKRPDGRYYSGQRPGALLSAVRARTEGISIPAPDRPEHRENWKIAVRGHQHLAGDQGCACDEEAPDDACSCRVLPATREHVNAILGLKYSELRYRGGAAVHARRPGNEAAFLVALDTRLSAATLGGVRAGEIELLADGSVEIAGAHVPCDHEPRERGVPWQCGACTVRALAAGAPEGALLFGKPGPLAELFAVRRREWHRTVHAPIRPNGTTSSQLLLREGLTVRQVAGVRLGLAASAWQNPEGAWLLGRAWFVLAFAAGYRMCADLAGLRRSAVSFTPDGGSINLTLAVTKSDQTAVETVVRPFHFESDHASPWAAECFAAYLAVRDALVGEAPDEPLWMCAPPDRARGRLIHSMADPAKVGNRMLADLTAALGLPHLTTYSARKGYAQEAFESGWKPTRVRAGLRHAFIETTLRHYRERAPQKTVSRLAGQRAAQVAARRARAGEA